MIRRVRTTPEADAQIAAIDEWWRRHRLAAPDLFLDELQASLDLVAGAPAIGRSYPQSPVPATRRILLRRSRYHVYYVAPESEVWILAVWHAQRGSGPPLRLP